MRGSDIIVEMLIQYGVEYVFGVPGDTSVLLYESFAGRRGEITHILCRDERSASFMADAYARLTNRPGVCECPSGAGALYNTPGVAEANASSIPVIALTSGIDLASEDKGTITELDHHVLYQTITKWSTFMKRYTRIPDTLRRAFRIATSGRPGSVHIAFPQEILKAEVPDGEKDIYAEPQCSRYPSFPARAERAKIEEAAKLLMKAERPVIVAGGGIWISGAQDELRGLAERLSAPVGTTVTGKGAFPEEHPLALGVIGDNGSRDYALEIIGEADLVFYVGCKTGSVATCNWSIPDARKPPPIIHLDIDPRLIGNNYPTAIDLIGDARANLTELAGALEHDIPGKRGEIIARIADLRAAWWEGAREAMTSAKVPFKPQRIMAALARSLPESAVVIADAGTPTPYLCAYLDIEGPGRRIIIPRAYGGLGYAIPAAVGASLARPWTPILALTGDGSFAMSCGELETLVRYDIPAVILVFNNSCFGWIKALQGLHTNLGKLGIPYCSVDFTRTDHAAVARAFGLQAFSVDDPSELEEIITRALSLKKPVLIDIPSEPEIRELPPVRSWRQAAR
jgi:acetolactate synthase I/II/III large subunit